MGIGSGKRPVNTAQNDEPLPIASSWRAPDSGPSTFRSRISQGIARRRVGILFIDRNEKSARRAKCALPLTNTQLTASIQSNNERIPFGWNQPNGIRL
jgi:hypothetical protein